MKEGIGWSRRPRRPEGAAAAAAAIVAVAAAAPATAAPATPAVAAAAAAGAAAGGTRNAAAAATMTRTREDDKRTGKCPVNVAGKNHESLGPTEVHAICKNTATYTVGRPLVRLGLVCFLS